MDKNTWIGFALIAVIILGFSLLNRPSKEEMERRQHYQDSIRYARQLEIETEEALRRAETEMKTAVAVDADTEAELLREVYGAFSKAVVGEHTTTILENNLIRLHISSLGGTIEKAELKTYQSYGDTLNPLVLFKEQDSELGFTLITANNRILHTRQLYFVPQPVELSSDGTQTFRMRLLTDSAAYMDFVYTLAPDDYMVSMSIQSVGMQPLLAQNLNSIEMHWNQLIPQQEKGRKFEERYAQLQYMYRDHDVEKLSETKNDSKNITGKLRWIAYKDQFFSTVLISENDIVAAQLTSNTMPKTSDYIKQYQTKASVGFDPTGVQTTDFRIYMGPNHYNTLKAYDKGLDKQDRLNLKTLVPLGWKMVSWINMWLVIPMFDMFMSWGMNIGLVILLMTLVIKLIILPFTFSSYRSTAKMRVLKPQIDAINEKYPPEKMQERQQATMALYQKAGVSPMSGCLPMLFQFPVLMAMFWFFPTAIELRGQSFLWAEDLSTYDAIFTWNMNIPLISWFFGNHISLFCLLMTVTNILYTWLNMQTQATGNDPSAKMMKWMMYLMPVFFMYIFNDYAAGLSYYYFVSLLITILQTYIFRWSIDDAKLLKQMEAKAAKNQKSPKKSSWVERLEKLQREQQKLARENAKRRK